MPRLYALGTALPLLCTVHCALTPLLALTLPLLATPAAEWTLLLAAILLPAGLLAATTPLHRHPGPALLTLCGIAVLAAAHPLQNWETPIRLTGSTAIAIALFWNRSLCHCQGCKPQGE